MPSPSRRVGLAMAFWGVSVLAAAAPQNPARVSPEAPPTEAASAAETPAGPVAEESTAELPAAIAAEASLVLPRCGDYKRTALHCDPIEAAIARGEWRAPQPGDAVRHANGAEVSWRVDDGSRGSELAGGYAYGVFNSPATGVMLLDAPGAAAVCLNGEWVPGDPYGVGWFRPPVLVEAGENTLLVHLARPTAECRLVRPTAPAAFLPTAATLPDLVATRPELIHVSVPLVNATLEPLEDLLLRYRWAGGEAETKPLRTIESLLITPITISPAAPPTDLAAGDVVRLLIEIIEADKADDKSAAAVPLATTELSLRVVDANETRTDTFVSEQDGSVQPYAVTPATGEPKQAGNPRAGVLLVLHDAGEAPRDALADLPSRGGVHLVAPGGRGRWGFDGEDWSRRDALEALADFEQRQARRQQPIDADRIAVLGRGMGGHAALRLATLAPARFSAASFIDAWISFYTQGGSRVTPSDATPIAKLLGRQSSANDPLRVLGNLRGMGVSLLHLGQSGVSATESRYLRERLGEFHNDFAFREATDGVDRVAALAEQVDWLLARTRGDANEADEVEFATPDVAAMSQQGWVTLLAAERQGEPATVRIRRDRGRRQVVGTTDNTRRLRLDLSAMRGGAAVTVRLDGGKPIEFTPGREGDALALARNRDGKWRAVPDVTGAAARFAPLFKEPGRNGGLKSAFVRRPQLVYGTRGDAEENRWSAAKARYDAHLFLYRGAGRLEVVSDRDLRETLRGASVDLDRSVVLYGNRRTNAAWSLLQQEAFLRRARTVRVDRGQVSLGARPELGDDLSVLAVRPRPGSRRASLGVVGGSGIVGMRMTTRLRYFWSGVTYPDFLIFGPDALTTPAEPSEAKDVRAAGYFDTDWGFDDGGVLWRDTAL